MGHVPSALRLRLVLALSVMLVTMTTVPAQGGGTVALQAQSATVSQPGDTAHICIMLATNGNQVAGTQNSLSWDGTCATVTDPPNCYAVGSHGKQVSRDLTHQPDFTLKVLVLALDNVEPIPDGPLYCCDFEGEADPGQCCPVTVVGAAASDPSGGKVAAMGNSATICTANAPDQPGGPGMGSGQPLTGGNAPVGNESGAGSAPAPAPAAPAAAPANQVLQGGGVRVENPTVSAAPPTAAPPVTAAPTAASSSSGGAAAPAAGSAPRPPLPPPTAALAATAAVTEASTQAPTEAATAPPAPTAPPTRNAPPPTQAAPMVRQQAAEPVAKAEDNRGWFGCEIASSSARPVFGLGLIALFGAMLQRRRRARRPPESRTQR
jgi:hypothetical protein